MALQTQTALTQSQELKSMQQSLSSQLSSFEQKIDSKDDIKNGSIFISIINYRDCEGQFTIKDLFEKASNPSRCFIGYCLQYDPKNDTKDINCHYLPLYQSKFSKNIRTLFVNYREARGPIYARYLVENRLFNNEKYYLQIDCHMRFIKDWDEILIKQYFKCNDSKAIITTYPNPYDDQYLSLLKDKFKTIKDWNGSSIVDINLLDNHSSLLCADKFANDGFLRIKSKRFNKYPEKPILSLFYAAGFNFSLSTVIKDCPQNPNLKCLFFGEESINAVRLFTNGYNFYTPTQAICYHLWNRKDFLRKGVWRDLFKDNKLNQLLTDLENKSKLNAQKLLNGQDNDKIYGLGKQRTLKQYQEFCGIDFKNKKISDDAKFGGIKESKREKLFQEFEQNKLMDLISSFQS